MQPLILLHEFGVPTVCAVAITPDVTRTAAAITTDAARVISLLIIKASTINPRTDPGKMPRKPYLPIDLRPQPIPTQDIAMRSDLPGEF